MSRFHAGFIQYHSLLRDLEFYWRVEPESKYLCDIDFDPFLFMKENNKKFGKLQRSLSASTLGASALYFFVSTFYTSVRHK
jgi:Glycolipid 2-alpha-mannosyltransferase